MSYQVLARKWRPQCFAAVVGQEHVVKILTNALNAGRIHHAYLFTGTRGVGKTSLARILAKALSCVVGISATPCGECAICRAIEAGNYLDLIEVDAASRTKVEDTRDLLENVSYLPVQGRFKIYLIDEVHMLSMHSFNALLKTLEEPPSHVKFLLATTDPQKLPITILSRCLQFNLRALPETRISEQLEKILTTEKIPFESEALSLLASRAAGSMRDALSLLDEAISYTDQQVTAAEVSHMLGLVDDIKLTQFLTALAKHEYETAYKILLTIDFDTVKLDSLLDALLEKLHQIALQQFLSDNFSNDHSLTTLSSLFTPEEVQLNYQIALLTKRDLMLSPTPKVALEMMFLRMAAFKLGSAPLKSKPLNQFAPKNTDLVTTTETKSLPLDQEKTTIAEQIELSKTAEIMLDSSIDYQNFSLTKLGLEGATKALIDYCVIKNISSTAIEIAVDSCAKNLLTPRLKTHLQEAIDRYFGRSVYLAIVVSENQLETPDKIAKQKIAAAKKAAESEVANNQYIKELLNIFDGQILTTTNKSLES